MNGREPAVAGADLAAGIPFAAPRRRAWRRKSTTNAHVIVDLALVVVVVGSVLALGAVHRIVLLSFALPLFVAAIGAVVWRRSLWTQITAPAVLLGLLAAFSALQAVPLPMGVLRVLSPYSADVWSRSLLAFGENGPAWASISLDPGASCIEAVKWMLYALVFTMAVSTSVRRGGAWVTGCVFLTGVLLAVITLCHGLAGATHVYGFYKSRLEAAPWHVSPLINSNNLAGYLNMAVLCGLGLLIARRPLVPRWALGLGVAVLIGVAVVAASRAGFVALPIGFLMLAGCLRFGGVATRSKRREMGRTVGLLIMTALTGGVLFALLGATLETWHELYDKNVEKLAMLLWAKPLVRDNFWLGVGRGAFESVFPAYRTAVGNVVFTHAENFIAQWVAEWGVPVAALAFIAFGRMLRPSQLGVGRSAVCAGAWCGIVVLLIQNLLDLALEVPAVMIAMVVVFGAMWGDVDRTHVLRRSQVERATASKPIWHVPAVALAVAFAVLLSVASVKAARRSVSDERDELYANLQRLKADDVTAVRGFRDALRAATFRHPAEPYFPLAGAMAARLVRDQDPLPWLQRSLERGSVNGLAHLIVADLVVERHGADQALLELRAAMHDDPRLFEICVQRAVRWTRDFDALVRYAPLDGAGAGYLEALAGHLSGPENRDLSERLVQAAMARDPRRPGPHIALGIRLLSKLKEHGPSACPGSVVDGCEQEIERHLTAIERALPRTSDGARLRAAFYVAVGRFAEAEQILVLKCEEAEDRLACLSSLFHTIATIPGAKGLAKAAKDWANAGCGSRSECAYVCTQIGDVMGAHGDWGGAASYYRRAVADEPTEARWMRVAESAARLGAHVEAADALQKVAELRGKPSPDLAERIHYHRSRVLLNPLARP